MKLALIALLAAGCVSKPARDPDKGAPGDRAWKLIATATQPGALASPRLTYDPKTEHVYMYGGKSDTSAFTNELWRLDGGQWVQVCTDCLPNGNARYRPGFTHDGAQFYIYGGLDALSIQRSEVYVSTDGKDWRDYSTTGKSPGARDDPSLVPYGDKIFEVGGFAGGNAKNDVSSLDGDRWADETSVPMPVGGDGQAVSLDTDHDVILAREGYEGNIDIDNLWAYDHGSWTSWCTGCTGGTRSHESLVHIPGADVTLIIGGRNRSSGLYFAETWLAGADHRFAQIDASGVLPARSSSGVAFDPIGDRVILYGGVGPECENGCAGTYELVLK